MGADDEIASYHLRAKRIMMAINVLVGLLAIVSLAMSIAGFIIFPKLNPHACCLPKKACHNLWELENAVNVAFSGTDFYNKAIAERDPETGMCVLFGTSPLLTGYSGGDYGCSSDLALDVSEYPQRPQLSEDQFINTSSWPWNRTCVAQVDECGPQSEFNYKVMASVFLLITVPSCGFVLFGSISHRRIFSVPALVPLAIAGAVAGITIAAVGFKKSVSFSTVQDGGHETSSGAVFLRDVPDCPARYALSELVTITYLLPFGKDSTVPNPGSPDVYTLNDIKWLMGMHVACGFSAFVIAPIHLLLTKCFDH